MHKQNVAFVRLGRSLGIFSLKCKSTLQRCPKKVTIIISSIFAHVHASYMHLDAFSGNIRISKLHRNQTLEKIAFFLQAKHNFLHHDHHTSKHHSTQEHFQKTAHMAIEKAHKLLYSTAISRKLCVRERNYAAHIHKQHVAFVRLGRSLGIFSLKCKSTLQRCPKKVTIIISSIFAHVHASYMHPGAFSGNIRISKLHRNQTLEKIAFFLQTRHNFLHHDHHTSKHHSTQEHFQKTAHMAIEKANKLLYSTAISRKLCVRERNYTAHMHKQKAAFVRLGRSLGIFSLKCKSTLQRCPKKVTIIISSTLRHVHVLNSCTQFMFMQSQFFASCAQNRRRRKRNKTQASHAQLSSP